MTTVNCSVVSVSNRFLLPWTIIAVTIPGILVQNFYDDVILPKIPGGNRSGPFTMKGAFLGKSKECLDPIEVVIPLQLAVATFGHFLKFMVDDV